MDQEENVFYQHELLTFPQTHPSNLQNDKHILSIIATEQAQDVPIVYQDGSKNEYQQLFRANNPYDVWKGLLEEQHQYFMFNNHKRFNGIQHFFELGEEHSDQLLENMEFERVGNINNFQVDGVGERNCKQQIQISIINLHKRLDEINRKVINNMNISNTLSHTFYQHFQNYSKIWHQSTFKSQFQTAFDHMLRSNSFKAPGFDLITYIYQFWIKSFKDFVNQIWKYGSQFTNKFIKKQEHQHIPDTHPSQIKSQPCDVKSESSNTMGSEKRKGWSHEEGEILLKLIDCNTIFNQNILKKLAEQFNRSASSISSKIQKLIKNKKGFDLNPEESLLKKTIDIVKMSPQGLSKEAIIEKINENYKMGYGGQWQKSVGQLLSSRKQFIKLKCKYKLLNPENYKLAQTTEGEKGKLTMKDRIIQVFISFAKGEADMKSLVDRYCEMFEDGWRVDEQKRKSLQSNISKTLSRYDIFDCKTRTRYMLNPLQSRIAPNMQAQLGHYFFS